MDTLRSKLIRLAHEKPELREHLLPLVGKTAEFELPNTPLMKKVGRKCDEIKEAVRALTPKTVQMVDGELVQILQKLGRAPK